MPIILDWHLSTSCSMLAWQKKWCFLSDISRPYFLGNKILNSLYRKNLSTLLVFQFYVLWLTFSLDTDSWQHVCLWSTVLLLCLVLRSRHFLKWMLSNQVPVRRRQLATTFFLMMAKLQKPIGSTNLDLLLFSPSLSYIFYHTFW